MYPLCVLSTNLRSRMSSIMRGRSGEIPGVVVFITEAPVAIQGGSPRFATYETEHQNSLALRPQIETTPSSRAAALGRPSRARSQSLPAAGDHAQLRVSNRAAGASARYDSGQPALIEAA